jgi:hypothetical protein
MREANLERKVEENKCGSVVCGIDKSYNCLIKKN